jgi:flavin reductase (DIM6/NTAB) family NADH-FMN oxidoreductase RutF/DNA-binding GntR family transcriptional regulator
MTAIHAPFDAAQFRHVIGHFMSGVAVVSTADGGQLHGMTASAVCSLSLEPPMLVVCLNRSSPTQDAILRSGAFGVSILEQGQDAVAVRFATPRPDKFDDVSFHHGPLGQPLLDGSLARLECEVAESVVGGTHRVFIGAVRHADVRAGSPLAYYRGRFGRLELAVDDDALRRLRRMVLLREVDLAESLRPPELAERLRIPESSIVYALTRLLSDGLVVRDPSRGFVQVALDARTSDEAFEAKLVIDQGAAALALERASDAGLDDLVRVAADVPAVDGDRGPERVEQYVAANERFHRAMIALSGNAALVAAYDRLALTGIMSQVLIRDDAEHDRLAEDHRHIAAALRRREAVGRLIADHNRRGREAHHRAIVAAGGVI